MLLQQAKALLKQLSVSELKLLANDVNLELKNNKETTSQSIVNLCPHEVTFCDISGNPLFTLPKCSEPPRLPTVYEDAGDINGIPVTKAKFGDCELPMYKRGQYLLVPALIAQHMSAKRSDLICTNELVRGNNGEIIGCKSLKIL